MFNISKHFKVSANIESIPIITNHIDIQLKHCSKRTNTRARISFSVSSHNHCETEAKVKQSSMFVCVSFSGAVSFYFMTFTANDLLTCCYYCALFDSLTHNKIHRFMFNDMLATHIAMPIEYSFVFCSKSRTHTHTHQHRVKNTTKRYHSLQCLMTSHDEFRHSPMSGSL